MVVRGFGKPQETVLEHSSAVVAILAELPPPWPLVGRALAWLPRGLRDCGYRLVAANRYRIWGRSADCLIPTAAERGRFL